MKPTTRESSNIVEAVEVELFVVTEEICAKADHSSAPDDSWIIDSGAFQHMTSQKDWYTSLQPAGDAIIVAFENNAKCPAKGTCIISFVSSNGITKKLSNVLYVPDIERNIVVPVVIDCGLRVHFDQDGAVILDANDKVVGKKYIQMIARSY